MLRREHFFAAGGSDTDREIAWFAPDGREMDDVQWYDRGLRTLGMFVNGDALWTRGPRGEPIVDDSFLVVLHAGDAATTFVTPGLPWAESYDVVIDTAVEGMLDVPNRIDAGVRVGLESRSMLVLRACPPR